LVDKYCTLERDSSISALEKEKLMVEWWTQEHDLMVRHRMRKNYIKEMVESVRSNSRLRPVCTTLLDLLDEHKIPVAIASAGVADMLEEILKQHYENFDTSKNSLFHVVGNRMQFNNDGELVGWKEPLIHVMNKKSHLQKLEEDLSRHHVIVLGDHVQDAFMTSYIYTNLQLKIGFVNHQCEEELMRRNRKNFDILILNDGDMSFPNEIFRYILDY